MSRRKSTARSFRRQLVAGRTLGDSNAAQGPRVCGRGCADAGVQYRCEYGDFLYFHSFSAAVLRLHTAFTSFSDELALFFSLFIFLATEAVHRLDLMCNALLQESTGPAILGPPTSLPWSRTTSTSSNASGMSATKNSTASGAPSSGMSWNSTWTVATSAVVSPASGAHRAAQASYCPRHVRHTTPPVHEL